VKKAALGLVLAAGLLALAAAPAGAQCVMCKTALAGSPEGRGIGAQFNQAILVMIAAPYLVVGGFLLGVYRGRLAHDARRLGARLRGRLRRRATRRSPAPASATR
jgi:hypothetical protein